MPTIDDKNETEEEDMDLDYPESGKSDDDSDSASGSDDDDESSGSFLALSPTQNKSAPVFQSFTAVIVSTRLTEKHS